MDGTVYPDSSLISAIVQHPCVNIHQTVVQTLLVTLQSYFCISHYVTQRALSQYDRPCASVRLRRPILRRERINVPIAPHPRRCHPVKLPRLMFPYLAAGSGRPER